MKKDKRFKSAFTLAEVLITLVIIGVIAALTVPTLIQNTQKQEYVSALKKAYSTLSQAAQMIIAEEGNPKCNDGGWACTLDDVYNKFKKYLNSTKDCGAAKGCFRQHGEKGYKFLKGNGYTVQWNDADWNRNFILADGAQVMVFSVDRNCGKEWYGSRETCALTAVDINGEKSPNRYGRDVFYFALKENGLYPLGCDSEQCTDAGNGEGCACKVLREGAMNY